MRHNLGCPRPLAFVLLGERFGTPPWALEEGPLDRIEYYLNVISAEAGARELIVGLADDEPLIMHRG